MWQTCHEVVKKNSKIVPLGAPYNQPPRTLHITRSPGAEAFVETDHSRDCSSFVFCFRFILTWQIHWEQCCASSTQTEAELRFSKFSFVAVVGAAGVTLASASLAAPPLSYWHAASSLPEMQPQAPGSPPAGGAPSPTS
jgi:hypothetical protein